MDYKSVVKKELQLSKEECLELEEFMNKLMTESGKKGICFNESRKIAVAAHYVSLIRRLNTGEYLPKIDIDLVKSQIDSEIMDIALRCTKPIFKKFNMNIDESEVILIATHIGAAREDGTE